MQGELNMNRGGRASCRMPDYLECVRRTIEQAYACSAVHVASRPIIELFPRSRWEGNLEIFTLSGHPTAIRCYAWFYNPVLANVPGERIVTVLEGPFLLRAMATPKTVVLVS